MQPDDMKALWRHHWSAFMYAVVFVCSPKLLCTVYNFVTGGFRLSAGPLVASGHCLKELTSKVNQVAQT